ncbi:MAG: glycosyl transferase, family 2 [Firmicutes bacterium]|nr:glycosyl transferase, family 2 [Bacillota bacterium]
MISLIMPVYNAARFLDASITSILQQTERDFELIIVNDGSTDRSEEIILSSDDKRIRYVRQENKGVGAAREVGVGLAKGDFIVFQDADDISLPRRFQAMKSRFIADDIGIVHSDMLLIDETDRPIGYWTASNIDKSRLLRFFLQVGTPFNNPTMMLRREVMRDFHYDARLRIGEDSDMVFNVATQCDSVHIPEPLVLYRRYADSLTKQGDYDIHVLYVRKFLEQHSLRELFPEFAWGQYEDVNIVAMASILMVLFLVRRGLIPDAQEWSNKINRGECSENAKKFIAAIESLLAGRYEAGIKLLEQCSPRDWVIENYLGEAKALLGDFTQACGHFLRSLRLNPLYGEPVENLKALGMCRGLNLIDNTWAKFANAGK